MQAAMAHHVVPIPPIIPCSATVGRVEVYNRNSTKYLGNCCDNRMSYFTLWLNKGPAVRNYNFTGVSGMWNVSFTASPTTTSPWPGGNIVFNASNSYKLTTGTYGVNRSIIIW